MQASKRRLLTGSLALGVLGGVSPMTLAQTGSFSIVDALGRRVEFKRLPQTFAVASYIQSFVMAGGAQAVSRIIALARDGWQSTRIAEYQRYTEAFPHLKNVPSIGGYHDSVLNAERIIGLRPDVLVIDRMQANANAARLPIFEKAGIAVVVLDYHSMKEQTHLQSTMALGRLLGREAVTKAQCDRFHAVMQTIRERLATIPAEQKQRRVYVECGNEGVSRYSNTYNRTFLWGAMLEALEARGIGADMKTPYGVLDREFVLSQNPETIFIAGSIWLNNAQTDQMRMGLTVTEKEAQQRLDGFARRDQWDKLAAVQSKDVHAVDHGSIRSMLDYAFYMYMAKVLYPTAFADFDAAAEIANFYKTYLPEVNGSGTFVLKWQ